MFTNTVIFFKSSPAKLTWKETQMSCLFLKNIGEETYVVLGVLTDQVFQYYFCSSCFYP